MLEPTVLALVQGKDVVEEGSSTISRPKVCGVCRGRAKLDPEICDIFLT